MESVGARQLAVLGSPISHSRSPALHSAAYSVLGLDWNYDALEMSEAELAGFVGSRDDSWLGLSLTMPLKREVLPLLDRVDPIAQLTGAANTVWFNGGERLGFNTDVYGIAQAFREAGVTTLESVQVLGAGATAASVIAAAAQLGATRALVNARTPAKAQPLVELGMKQGVVVTVRPLDHQDRSLIVPDAIVSTLPGGTGHSLVFAEAVRARTVLFDVAYDPWPTELGRAWFDVDGTVIDGRHMLLHQAVAQVRIFLTGDAATPLDREREVIAAMRAALGD